MRPAHWLPPVLWMGVIMLLSTDTGSAAHTSELLLPLLHWLLPWASPGDLAAIHGLVRKGAHLTEYAILAALWYRAFTRGRRLTPPTAGWLAFRSEEHTSELQSHSDLVCRLLLEKKNIN